MKDITDDIMAAAHEAWETEAAKWRVDKCSFGAVAYEVFSPSATPASVNPTLIRFDTHEAAMIFKRDKIIRAILEAVHQ
jgi:hypothetical protein